MPPVLPDNLSTCHDEIRNLFARNEELAGRLAGLTLEKEALARQSAELAARVADLERQIEWFKKQMFGSKSERRADAPADSLAGDLFGKPAEATAEEIREETSEPEKKSRRRRHGRKPLPAHLDRKEIPYDVSPEEKICSCCGKEMVQIDGDVTEQLEIIPAKVFVLRHVRPKYVCPTCKNRVIQPPLPPQPAPRASVGPGFLAWLITSKYADHLPLCRLERILARHEIDLPRARMCDWLMTVAALLAPLVKRMRTKVVEGGAIQADETSIRLQVKGKNGKTERAWVWVYVGGKAAPYTFYDFRRSRGADAPKEILEAFEGTLQCDGYAAYEGVGVKGKVVRAGCWSHARRGFTEAEDGGDSRPRTAINHIKELFKIEQEWKTGDAKIMTEPQWRELSPEERRAESERLYEMRRALRQEKSKPIVEALREWMEERLDVLPASQLGKAIGYAQNQWDTLKRFLEDGRIEIDNNAAERALRPIAVGRKNWLFAGSERGGRAVATFFTLLESARRNGLNPQQYLKDILTRLPAHPINRIDELLPDRWKRPAPD